MSMKGSGNWLVCPMVGFVVALSLEYDLAHERSKCGQVIMML